KKRGALSAEEVNWSLGAYTPLKEIESKFNVELPSPAAVAPNQPWPHKKVYAYWLVLLVAAFLVGLIALVAAPRATVFTQSYTLQPSPTPTPAASPATPDADGGAEKAQVIFTDPIPLRGRRNI